MWGEGGQIAQSRLVLWISTRPPCWGLRLAMPQFLWETSIHLHPPKTHPKCPSSLPFTPIATTPNGLSALLPGKCSKAPRSLQQVDLYLGGALPSHPQLLQRKPTVNSSPDIPWKWLISQINWMGSNIKIFFKKRVGSLKSDRFKHHLGSLVRVARIPSNGWTVHDLGIPSVLSNTKQSNSLAILMLELFKENPGHIIIIAFSFSKLLRCKMYAWSSQLKMKNEAWFDSKSSPGEILNRLFFFFFHKMITAPEYYFFFFKKNLWDHMWRLFLGLSYESLL